MQGLNTASYNSASLTGYYLLACEQRVIWPQRVRTDNSILLIKLRLKLLL
jgi:hypothetical protein